MRFPIDALFLDRNLRVLEIVERLRPWRVASKRQARCVLELSAGECARRGVRVGDRLGLRDRTSPDVSQPGSAEAEDRSSAYVEQPTSHAGRESAAFDGAPLLYRGGAAHARLQPLRILIISHDGHFRNVMSLLLARRNCSVTTTANSGRVAELIAREGVDVAVIDISHAPDAAAATTVEALDRPVGVVLVDLEGASESPDAPVLAKWGLFAELFAAIELADESRALHGGVGDRS
jgi:CheY-like chemotaxis protein